MTNTLFGYRLLTKYKYNSNFINWSTFFDIIVYVFYPILSIFYCLCTDRQVLVLNSADYVEASVIVRHHRYFFHCFQVYWVFKWTGLRTVLEVSNTVFVENHKIQLRLFLFIIELFIDIFDFKKTRLISAFVGFYLFESVVFENRCESLELMFVLVAFFDFDLLLVSRVSYGYFLLNVGLDVRVDRNRRMLISGGWYLAQIRMRIIS